LTPSDFIFQFFADHPEHNSPERRLAIRQFSRELADALYQLRIEQGMRILDASDFATLLYDLANLTVPERKREKVA
jgi:hypothetical protein